MYYNKPLAKETEVKVVTDLFKKKIYTCKEINSFCVRITEIRNHKGKTLYKSKLAGKRKKLVNKLF